MKALPLMLALVLLSLVPEPGFGPARSFAQMKEVSFEHLSLEQGLSQSSVFSIVQDRQGFLWFATQDGLNRYDGYSFVAYKNIPHDTASLSDNYVVSLLVDHEGVLWIGTRAGGLNRFDPASQTFRRYRHGAGAAAGSGFDYIERIIEDRAGTIYLQTIAGVDLLPSGRNGIVPFHPANLPAPFQVSNMKVTLGGDGRIWIADSGKFFLYDPQSRILDTIINSNDYYFSVPLDVPRGKSCLFWSHGLKSIDPDTKAISTLVAPGNWNPRFGFQTPQSSLVDAGGFVWIGTDSGLIRLSPDLKQLRHFSHERFNEESLSENTVLSLYVDRSGVLWAGTYGGINKFAPGRYAFLHYFGSSPDSLDSRWNRIRSILELDDRTMLIGSDLGFWHFDRERDVLLPYLERPGDNAKFKTNSVLSMCEEDSAGARILWIGTNGGALLRYERMPDRVWKYKTVYYPGNTDGGIPGVVVANLLHAADGDLYVGTRYNGLGMLDRLHKRFRAFPVDPAGLTGPTASDIFSLLQDPDGDVWVGTGNGLCRYTPRTGVWKAFFNRQGDRSTLSGNRIPSLCVDSSGVLWVGTYNGLNKFIRENESFEHFSEADGLPDNVIYAILPGSAGELWLSTNRGLSRFDVTRRLFRNYDVTDGLQSSEFNGGVCFKNSRGELFFGGVNGFNVFHPDSIRDNPNLPAVRFVGFRLFNKRLRPGTGDGRLAADITLDSVVRLDYFDNVFTIEFSALEFTAPSKNLYSYMMVGVDHDWVNAGTRREATYTHLDPGVYTFRVRASNNNGVWNMEGATLTVVITPPFWMTWWFRAAAALVLLAIGPLVYYRRVAGLEREQRIRQEFSRNLIRSQESERARIASDLHDGVGQQLLVLKNKLQLALRGLPDEESRTQVQVAADFAGKAIEEIRGISHNLRPSLLDQFGLTLALEAVVEAVAESTTTSFSMNLENVDGLLSPDEEINLFRIVQEALNNIVKHSNAANAVVSIGRRSGDIVLEISDDGLGISEAVSTQFSNIGMFGVAGMRERARICGGAFHISRRAVGGTLLRVTIPAGPSSSRNTNDG